MAAKNRASRRPGDGPPTLQQMYDREQAAKQVQTSDHGARGLAAKSRPSRVVLTEEGEKQRVYEDTDMLDLARQANVMDQRQCDAIAKLSDFYWEARPPARTCAAYGKRVAGGLSEMTDQQAAAWARYCGLLDRAPADTKHALATVARGEWPVMTNGVGLLRRGAAALADHLKLPG